MQRGSDEAGRILDDDNVMHHAELLEYSGLRQHYEMQRKMALETRNREEDIRRRKEEVGIIIQI
jgi:hypothetical protein